MVQFDRALEDGVEELVAEKDLRRHPFFRVGDVVEVQYTEDQQWYKAVVDERLQSQYVVTFENYGNTQQCSVDFMRSLPGESCKACQGPDEVVDGCCYFCGVESSKANSQMKQQQKGAKDSSLLEPDNAAITTPHSGAREIDVPRLHSEIDRLIRENNELKARLQLATPDNQENFELRERLHEVKELFSN
jgi:curved DNA-binding protein CbpA